MEVFNESTGKYENDKAIKLTPELSDDERAGLRLSEVRDGHQTATNRAKGNLETSEGILYTATQNLAEYNVKKDKIAADTNLNDVTRQTAFSVLNDANRGLELSLDLAQTRYDEDNDVFTKANAKLITANNAFKSHNIAVANTPTPAEVEEFKQMKRTTMDEATRMRIISTMGMEFYTSLQY